MPFGGQVAASLLHKSGGGDGKMHSHGRSKSSSVSKEDMECTTMKSAFKVTPPRILLRFPPSMLCPRHTALNRKKEDHF